MPLLKAEKLLKIYGRGCSHCQDGQWEQRKTNRCEHCGSLVAVSDISLELEPGEALAIIGESGSGKSTLVRMLYGEECPTAGSVLFDAPEGLTDLHGLHAANRRRIRNEHFGMVYQNPHLGLNFGVSAGGNIAEPLLMKGVDSYEQIREQAHQLLERTQFDVSRIDDFPSNFSGGMQQRVQIARALATRPELLFLDEVTTGLDLSVQASLLDLILELQYSLGIAMVIVTHDLGVARMLAARTLVMKDGRLVESGLTDQILEDPVEAYTQTLVSSSLNV